MMAEQVRPAHGKPTTTLALPRPLSTIGFRARAFHHGPDRKRSSREAEDTFAVLPLSLRSILAQLHQHAPLNVAAKAAAFLWLIALPFDGVQWGFRWRLGSQPAAIRELALTLVPPHEVRPSADLHQVRPRGGSAMAGALPLHPGGAPPLHPGYDRGPPFLLDGGVQIPVVGRPFNDPSQVHVAMCRSRSFASPRADLDQTVSPAQVLFSAAAPSSACSTNSPNLGSAASSGAECRMIEAKSRARGESGNTPSATSHVVSARASKSLASSPDDALGHNSESDESGSRSGSSLPARPSRIAWTAAMASACDEQCGKHRLP